MPTRLPKQFGQEVMEFFYLFNFSLPAKGDNKRNTFTLGISNFSHFRHFKPVVACPNRYRRAALPHYDLNRISCILSIKA